MFTSAVTSDTHAYTRAHTYTHTHTHTQVHVAECFCVSDNARDAVLLHVSASSERQEEGNETGSIKKRTKRQILKINYVYGSIFIGRDPSAS